MPFILRPFRTIVRLLDRLSYRWKFATVAIVFVAAMLVFLQQINASYREQIVATEHKIAGLAVADDALNLLLEVQLERGIAYAALKHGGGFAPRLPQQAAAVRRGIDRLDESLARTHSLRGLRPRWDALRGELKGAMDSTDGRADARHSFDMHTAAIRKLLAFIVDIGDQSSLASEASPALFHLNLMQLRTLPEFVESIANLRGFAIGNALGGGVSVRTRFELASRMAALDVAETALNDRVERISATQPDILSNDRPEVRKLRTLVDSLRASLHSDPAVAPPVTDVNEFFTLASSVIAQAAEIHRSRLYPGSLAMLDARLDELRQRLRENVAAFVALFLVVATLFSAMYVSIRRAVAELSRGSTAFASGKLGVRVGIESRDELRQVGLQFNTMAEEIRNLIDAQRAQSKRLSDLLRNNPSVVFALDAQTLQGTFLSPNAGALLGLSSGDDRTDLQHWLDGIHAEQQGALREAFSAWRSGGFKGVLRGAYRLARKANGVSWIELQLSAVRDDAGAVVEIVGSCTDITERKLAQTKLELAASVFSSAREGIIISDAGGRIIEVNDAFSHITGWSREEIIGKTPRVLQSGRHDAAFYESLWAELVEKGHWEGEIWNRHKSGRAFAETIAISLVRDQAGTVSHYVALFSDITRQKENEQRLRRLAHFDPLTGLPNRTLLADRMEQALAHGQRTGKLVAVALIDLDGFKAVNDAYGHDAGDNLLQTVSRRMKNCLRTEDTIARLGGDEFVAVMGSLDDRKGVEQALDRLLAAINEPVVFPDASVKVSGSIGIAFFPQVEPIEAEQLLRQADQAMYAAKVSGKNRYRVFDEMARAS